MHQGGSSAREKSYKTKSIYSKKLVDYNCWPATWRQIMLDILYIETVYAHGCGEKGTI